VGGEGAQERGLAGTCAAAKVAANIHVPVKSAAR
jgi:hypothetical protein